MLTLSIHNRNTGLDRKITIDGFTKSSGTKVARVTDRNEIYFVEVHANGKTSCKTAKGGKCDDRTYTYAVAFVDLPSADTIAPAEPVVSQPVKRSSEDAPLYRATFGIPKSWKELEAEAAAKEEKIA
jgi:hypothetical protein